MEKLFFTAYCTYNQSFFILFFIYIFSVFLVFLELKRWRGLMMVTLFSLNCLNFDLFVVNYETLSSC